MPTTQDAALEDAAPVIDACWDRIGVRGDSSCPELPQYIRCRNCPVYAAAAAELLARTPPAGHHAAWTSHFARSAPPQHTSTEDVTLRSVVIFRIGAEWLALATSVFKEVAELRTVHSLPYRGEAVLGLVNMHGALLVCVSLARLLGLDAAQGAETGQPRLMVIGRGADRIVFPVDEVHGTHRCRSCDVGGPLATVADATTYVTGILAWRTHEVACLDEALLFAALDRSIA
jgi:chemotaxis-related protein WspD